MLLLALRCLCSSLSYSTEENHRIIHLEGWKESDKYTHREAQRATHKKMSSSSSYPPSAHPAAVPAVLTTPWTTETLDSCLRTMHLPKSKHHHQAVLQWVQKALEKDESTTNKPSVSTQYAMALVLLRVATTGWKGVIVDDLVEVYFRLASARRNDWSVVSVVRWCLHVLTIAREQWPPVEEDEEDDDQEEDTAEDEEENATTSDNNDKDSSDKKDNNDNKSSKSKFTLQSDVSIIEEQLKEILLKADQATNSFFSFWTVWDKVCPALLSPPVGNTTKTMVPIVDHLVFPVAATEDKSRDQDSDNSEEQDVNYDILCLSWKLTCLAEATLEDRSKRTGSKYHPLLASTAGFALLISLAFWNRKEGSDKKEDEDEDDEEKDSKERNVFAIPHKKDEKLEPTVKEPATKRARHVVTVDQDSFLKWLIETRLPSTRTIPQLQHQPDSPKLTVSQVLDAAKPMIQNLCKEVMGGSFLSVAPAPDPVDRKDKWPAWVKPLSDFTGFPADMPKRLFENFDKILSDQCNRSFVVKERCVCDITRLMQTYLNTGKNPAAAMKNNSDLQAVPIFRPPQVKSGASATSSNPFFQAAMAPGVAMSTASGPIAQPVVTMQVQQPPPSTAASASTASPEQPAIQPAARSFPVNFRKSSDAPLGFGPSAAAPYRPYPAPSTVPQATHNAPARKVADTKKTIGRKQTLETTPQKKVELSLNPHDLAAAMELAVAETKKLEDVPSFLSTTRSVTPPAITEAMELTEWTVSLFCLESVKPSSKLKEYLEAASKSGGGGGGSGGAQQWHEVMLPILNRTLLRLAQEGLHEKPPRSALVSVLSEPVAGAVQIHGNTTPDKQLGKAVVALYYHALEAVLYVESTRLKVTSHPQIVLYPVFHRALLACCTWCVTKAVGVTQKLRASPSLQAIQIHSTLQVCESNPYDFLKVSDSFLRSLTLETARGKLGSPLIFALPRTLHKDLKQVETNVADSLLWAHGVKMQGSLPTQIEEFREKTEKGNVTFWPTEVLAPTLPEEIQDKRSEDKEYSFPAPEHEDYAEYRCVNFVVRKIIKLAFLRIEALCRFLGVPPVIPLATHAWVAFRFLVRNRPDVLFDRHIDHWILCCLYGVSKSIKYTPELTFSRIIEAYVVVRGPEVGDVTCQRIVRHIKIYEDSNDPNNADNIIVLYNRRFVPVMKEHLLGSKSLRRVADEMPKLLAEMRGGDAAENETMTS